MHDVLPVAHGNCLGHLVEHTTNVWLLEDIISEVLFAEETPEVELHQLEDDADVLLVFEKADWF